MAKGTVAVLDINEDETLVGVVFNDSILLLFFLWGIDNWGTGAICAHLPSSITHGVFYLCDLTQYVR